MTPSDDILDLLGRYATGSLTEEERQRLFDAALNDQELFEQLAREQELKLLLDQPGAKNRMIRALEPPRRKAGWIFGIAATAAMSVAVMIVLLRPSPKPTPLSVARVAPPAPVVETAITPAPVLARSEESSPRDLAPKPAAKSRPEPARAAPLAKNKITVADQESASAVPIVAVPNAAAPNTDQPAKDAVKKQEVQVQASQTVEVQAAQQFVPAQQGAAGGPRQIAEQSRAMKIAGLLDRKTSGLGFHYSLATKGHLIIVPSADGYLFVKSAEGTVLYGRKQIAAAIRIDIPLPDAADSVTITFSVTDSQVQTTPIARTEPEGVVDGAAQAIQLRIKP